jgi:cyclomaltodextrinase / maltogenic alpha-amylase / neopullulanase
MVNKFINRRHDWRYGGLVYQIFVDRFAPSLHLEQKTHLYPTPKTLKPWNQLPVSGKKLQSVPHYQHELDFWGGDIPSLTSKVDYLKQLGVNTIYLNPIFHAYSNHKYDTIDYRLIAPEYGTMDDFKQFIHRLKNEGMHLILDGVFNHMSFFSPQFQEAQSNQNSPYRSWFDFSSSYRHGYRSWHHAASLPELDLTQDHVRKYLFQEVVQYYIKLGIDGWRLDTAIELGMTYLKELTDHAHTVNPQSLVIGEINHYPAGWFAYLDGVMQLTMRDLIIQTMKGFIKPELANRQIAQYISDSGVDHLLKSWLLLENHDTSRIAYELQDFSLYRLAKILQFSLPGTVQLYQGEELGLVAKDDPYNRQTFPWYIVNHPSEFQSLHHQLIRIRNESTALRIGDYKKIESSNIIAYIRHTDRHDETIIVLVNPNNFPVEETLLIPDPLLKSHVQFVDLLSQKVMIHTWGIFLKITVPAQEGFILKPIVGPVDGYDPTKYFYK